MLFSSPCFLLPMAIPTQITYPRITEMYGTRAAGGRVSVVFLWRPTVALTAIMTAGVAVLWVLLPTGDSISFCPDNVEGVQAVRWASLDAILVSLMTVRSVFFTVRKQNYYLVATVVGIAVYFGRASAVVAERALPRSLFPRAS